MTACRALLSFVLGVSFTLCFAPSSARAEGDEDAATAAAKQHNIQAKKLFNLGLFKEAAVEYEKGVQGQGCAGVPL
ncbi:MAG: hypothetical protein JRH20_24105 [Deltaproteobacteria bacterium]|nr:hypothetical protein [Deltaproteobacteria bacterium]